MWESVVVSPPPRPQRCGHLIVMDDALGKGLVQHLLVPLLQALWLGDFLIRGVAMEDVVVSFTWGTGPDVSCYIPAGHTHNSDGSSEQNHPCL